jgi:biotin carboxyl carrier protein
MDLNEGVRFLSGKAKTSLPLKKKEEPKAPAPAPATPAAAPAAPAPVLSGPVTTTCTVEEGGTVKTFRITIEPPAAPAAPAAAPAPAAGPAAPKGTPVFSPFEGKTELVEVLVKAGDTVKEGQVVAAVEAMKAKHDVRSPCAGKVLSVDARPGDDVRAGVPILRIGG